MKEQTLRYPGHGELMRVMRHTGLFGATPIAVGDVEVRPLDVTSALLFKQWDARPVRGGVHDSALSWRRGNAAMSVCGTRLTCTTNTTRETGMSSMARTTAFPNVIAAGMVARGEISSAGVLPPELLARQSGMFEAMCSGLAARGVHLETQEERLPTP